MRRGRWGGQEAFKGIDVTGQGFGAAFNLVGHDGKPHTQASFAGKVVMLGFGFTQCPDVCSTTPAALAQTTMALKEETRGIHTLFVAIGRKRDTEAYCELMTCPEL